MSSWTRDISLWARTKVTDRGDELQVYESASPDSSSRVSVGLRMLHNRPQREQWKYTATSVRSTAGSAMA
jgi:hypothetical protein